MLNPAAPFRDKHLLHFFSCTYWVLFQHNGANFDYSIVLPAPVLMTVKLYPRLYTLPAPLHKCQFPLRMVIQSSPLGCLKH